MLEYEVFLLASGEEKQQTAVLKWKNLFFSRIFT